MNIMGRSSVVWVGLALCVVLTGCGGPQNIRSNGSQPSFYAQEVRADEPLVYWSPDEGVPGVLDAPDKAVSLGEQRAVAIDGGDVGGATFALEAWVKGARGPLLSYTVSEGGRALGLDMAETLTVTILGEQVDTGVMVADRRWQLVGLSWRSSDGRALVVVDGREVWRGTLAEGRLIDSGGAWTLGGTRGALDEVAIFDVYKTPDQWLDRFHVAKGINPASTPNADLSIKATVQAGHGQMISAVCWNPDGTRFASGSRDKTVKIWDAATGRLLHELAGHDESIKTVDWSPDGRWLASGAAKGEIKVWDASTGSLLTGFVGHDPEETVWEGTLVRWSPDGTRLATGGDDGAVKIWNVSGWWLEHTLDDHDWSINTLSWSADGTRLATSSWKDGEVKVWDTRAGALLFDLVGHSKGTKGKITGLVWSPDGTRLASGAWDNTIKIWDGLEGGLLHDIATDQVTSLFWSPRGDRLASTGKVLTLWDPATGHRVHEMAGHPNYIASVAWGPDGTRLVSFGGEDPTPKVWSVDGELLYELVGHGTNIKAARWSPKGDVLVSGDELGNLRVWDADGGQVHEIRGHHRWIMSVDWSPDGTMLASGNLDKTLHVWDLATGVLLHHFGGHKGSINAVAWSPDGSMLASASGDFSVKIWDVARGRLLRDLNGHQGAVKSVRWSPDGRRLVSAGGWSGKKGEVKVWDVETGRLEHDLEGHTETVSVLSVDPDGQRVVSVSTRMLGGVQRTEVFTWDLATGEQLSATKEPYEWAVWSVGWSHDGGRFAAVDEGRRVQIWDRARVSVLDEFAASDAFISTMRWSPDDGEIVSGHADGSVRVWDVASGAVLNHLKGHTNFVGAVGWSPDGERVVSGSRDGSLKVWDVKRGGVVTLIADGSGEWVVLNDGGYFAGTARPPVALVQGSRVFDIAQLAPALNRPDKILSSLRGSAAQVAFYEALWLRRLKRSGLTPEEVKADFTAVPSARIVLVAKPDDQGRTTAHVILSDRVGLRRYRAYVNGVPLGEAVDVRGTRDRVEIPIQLSKGPNLIEVEALNVQGLESLRDASLFEYDGRGLDAPRLFFLGFGVSDYADDRLDLGFAHQDVLDLESRLRSARGAFASVETQVFTNTQVHEGALSKARAFLERVTEQDTLVVFIAGHGARGDDAARTYYYLDHDARFEDLEETALPFKDMESMLYGAKARKKLLLMDTCQSGDDIDVGGLEAQLEGVQGVKARSIRGFVRKAGVALSAQEEDLGRKWLGALRARNRLILQDLDRRSGAIVLASSLGKESSLESASWRNGAFTEELLNALGSSVADANGDGFVDTDELGKHVMMAVPALTRRLQHPNIERDNPHQKFTLPLLVR